MVTTSIPAPRTPGIPAPRTSHVGDRSRTRLRDRVSAGGATVLSVAGLIGVIGLIALGLLVIPLAAVLAFGPALLAHIR